MAMSQRMEKRRHEEIVSLRLLREQKQRLENASKITGKAQVELIRDAVMIHVAEIEEQVRVAKENKTEIDARAFVPRNAYSSRGLGLKSNSDQAVVPAAAPTAAPPLPTVVVQTVAAPPPSSPDFGVDRFAKFIVGNGSSDGPFERDRRMRQVVEMLRATAKDKDEVDRLAKLLDEEIIKVEQKMREKSRSSWFSR